MTYSQDQLSQYLAHISYPSSKHPTHDPLAFLTELQAHQLCRVPFESVSLHYSTHRTLSLDLDDLFDKVVVRSHGGYCMELNAFFGGILRALGFTVCSVGGRVRVGERYTGWSHMVNIVTINDTRYLVDVSFGADGPTHPIPLTSGYTNKNVSPHELLLEYRGLGQHTDPNQRVWVYSTREPSSAPADGAELTSWQERYSFIEIEFFPEDYAVMNLSTMTRPTSYFVQTVLASVFLPDEKSGRPVGVLTLHKDEVKRRNRDGSIEVLEKLQNEEQRVEALEKYFKIALKDSERRAIKGWPTELRGP